MGKRYKLRKGIVKTTVCGETLLVATREIRGTCPYTLHLDSAAIYLLALVESESDESRMIADITEHFGVTEEIALKNLTCFIDQMEAYGCIVPEDGE